MAVRRRLSLLTGIIAVLLLASLHTTSILATRTADSAVMAVTARTADRLSGRQPVRKGPFALILVVDAARFDEFNLDQMPNVSRLVAGGTMYARAWAGNLPSVTEASHATIGTGVLPARHGILGDTWRVPGKNQMTPNLLSGQLTRTGYIGKIIRQAGAPSLGAMVHQKYPGSIVVALSGHKVYAADALGAGTADFVAFGIQDARKHYIPSAIPGHAPSQRILGSPQLDLPSYPRVPGEEDAWVTTLTEKFLFKYHPRLMMVNFPEVDIYGHVAGTSATVMQPLISNIDHQVGRLLAAYGRAGMLSQTYFVITADHAMVPGLHSVASSVIDRVIQLAGGQALYVGHGDYSPIWLKNTSAVPRVAEALANANIPEIAAVYAKNAQGRYTIVSHTSRLATPDVQSAYADLLSSFNNPTSPDIVLLYDENTITMTPLYVKIGRKGDHGGASWGAQHIPLILAGPGIKQAYQSNYPARLVDIAPTLETLMGMTPSKQDGVPLADAMIKPPSWAVAAQNRQSPRLLDDITGLQREADLRPNTGP